MNYRKQMLFTNALIAGHILSYTVGNALAVDGGGNNAF